MDFFVVCLRLRENTNSRDVGTVRSVVQTSPPERTPQPYPLFESKNLPCCNATTGAAFSEGAD